MYRDASVEAGPTVGKEKMGSLQEIEEKRARHCGFSQNRCIQSCTVILKTTNVLGCEIVFVISAGPLLDLEYHDFRRPIQRRSMEFVGCKSDYNVDALKTGVLFSRGPSQQESMMIRREENPCHPSYKKHSKMPHSTRRRKRAWMPNGNAPLLCLMMRR